MKKTKTISYSQSGVNYEALDPIKKLALSYAKNTALHLASHGYDEVEDSRGESAYVWKQGNRIMASVIEGLGTKNLVADAMREKTHKTYYDNIGHDTIAAIVNDLISVGARPLVIHAYWALGDSKFLSDQKRMTDLVTGWKKACDLSGASWGGGETPTYNGIINPETIDLGGCAIGYIKKKKHLLIDKRIKKGDRILLLRSSGINVNGLSLARAVASKLSKGYSTTLPSGKMYGEELLTKANIYVKLLADLQDDNIDIHYISNITGHGLRKIMRGRQSFSYILEKIFEPQEVFSFIQKCAGLSDSEMYETYNMGQDYAIFIPEKDMRKALEIVKRNRFKGIDGGYVDKGERQVIIKPKNIVFKGERLDLR